MNATTDMAAFIAEMRQEFLEGCEDRLDQVDEALVHMTEGGADKDAALFEILRHVHSIKGLGGSFGFSGISKLAHALEDYVEMSREVGADQMFDVQLFVDCIRDLMERDTNPTDDQVAEIIHALPLKGRRAGRKGLKQDLRILLFMPKSVQRKIVAAELSSFGFHVTIAETALSAIDLALTHRPDIIVASMYQERLNGIELARVFQAMDATYHARVMLMTASDLSASKLASIPDNATVVRKGINFSRELLRFLKGNNFLD